MLRAERFTAALTARIGDPALRELPEAGAVEQFVDSTDVLARPESARRAAWSRLRLGPAGEAGAVR